MSIETIAMLSFVSIGIIFIAAIIFIFSGVHSKKERIAITMGWVGIVSFLSLSVFGVHKLGAM
jgi:hypothetical protein